MVLKGHRERRGQEGRESAKRASASSTSHDLEAVYASASEEACSDGVAREGALVLVLFDGLMLKRPLKIEKDVYEVFDGPLTGLSETAGDGEEDGA